MPRQNHDLVRHAHPQPLLLPAFSLLLALPVAIRRCCAPPCTQHRGSHSSKAPQPEVRGDHPRCSHTQCRHAPQAWGAKTPSHFMWLLCPLPNPASHQPASSPSDLLHGARLCKQPAARPSQRQPSSAARTGSVQQPTVSQSISPQLSAPAPLDTRAHTCQSGRTQPISDSNSTPSATSEPFATQMVPEGRSVGSRGQRSEEAPQAWFALARSNDLHR